MKKIITLLTTLFLMSNLTAQKIKVTYNGQTVAPNSTIELKATKEHLFDDVYSITASDNDQLIVRYQKGKTLIVNYVVEELTGKFDELSFCPTSCYTATMDNCKEVHSFQLSMNSAAMPLKHHTEFNSEYTGASMVKTKVTLVDFATNDVFVFYIKDSYTPPTPTGIENVNATQPILNGETVEYAFGTNATHYLTLYNTVGQKIATQRLGLKGSFRLAGTLPHGIYIVSISENGKNIWTRKIGH